MEQHNNLSELYYREVDTTKRSYASLCVQSAAKCALNMYDEALDDACSAMALRTDGPKSFEMKATVLLRMRRYNEAFRTYLEGLSLSPTNPVLQKGLRDFLVQMIIMKEEVEMGSRSVTLPSPPRDVNSLQITNISLTRQEMLKHILDCPVCLCTISQPTLLPCGHTLCLDCLKDLSHADRCPVCERKIPSSYTPTASYTVNSIYENHLHQTTQAMESISSADSLYEDGELSDALQLYSKAIEQDPTLQLAFLRRSRCHLDQGDPSSSLKDGLSALFMQPHNGMGQLSLANTYLHQNNFTFSLYYCTKAESLCSVRESTKLLFSRIVTSMVSQASLPTSLDQVLSVSSYISSKDMLPTASLRVEAAESELECQLCFNVFFDPVTTSCGHSFCRSCLCRSLERKGHCPYCRTAISVTRYYKKSNTDILLDKLSWITHPNMYQERLSASIERERKETTDVPIFVCTMAFPKVKCPLLIFEPRYKLMINRCINSDRTRFGMCLPSVGAGYLEVGVMLEIHETKSTHDGNILVDCTGTRRFRVHKRSVIDEYNIADIEFFEDDEEELEENNEDEVESLVQRGSEYIQRARLQMPENRRNEFDNYYGQMPADPIDFSLWLLAVLPIDSYEKYHLLSSTSSLHRLRQLILMIE